MEVLQVTVGNRRSHLDCLQSHGGKSGGFPDFPLLLVTGEGVSMVGPWGENFIEQV